MARFVSWLGRNADGLIALLIAVSIGVLGLADVVGTDQVNEATLLILAVVAVVLLRDRISGRSMEREVQKVLDRAGSIEQTVGVMHRAMDEMAGVRILAGPDVGRALEEARRGTDTWMFKGGTGTYVRAVTLPRLADDARQQARRITVRLEIIDPTDTEICERYARFRRSLSPRPDADRREVDARPHEEGVVRHGARRLLVPAAVRAARHRGAIVVGGHDISVGFVQQLHYHHARRSAGSRVDVRARKVEVIL